MKVGLPCTSVFDVILFRWVGWWSPSWSFIKNSVGGGGGVLEGGVTELNDLGGLEQKRLDIDEDWKHED